jgi:HKD family nuclease
MEFLTDGIGNRLLEALGKATQVRIASAFFSPSSETIELLNAVRHLTLVISEEFTVNDPHKLEKLTTATKLSIPPDSDDGKLHAKVFIADMPDGVVWVLIGSANLTEQGLFYNQEACIALDSTKPEDHKAITDARHWFQSLEKSAREIQIAQAKAIWKTRGRQRLTPVTKLNQAAPAYWAIKPTEGSGPNAPNHWSMFESESVIALGWEAVAVNPATVDDEELYGAVTNAYPELTQRQAQYAVGTLRKFAGLPVGALVMVSHGYSSTAKDTNCVHVYAFARLTGTLSAFPFEPGIWRFRRSAELQVVHDWINVGVLRKLLDLGSFMTTLHELRRDGIEAVAQELGIQIGV